MTSSEKLTLSAYAIKLPLIKKGEKLVPLIVSTLKEKGISLSRGDIIVIASKALSASLGSRVKLASARPSSRASKLARDYGLEPHFVEFVVREAEKIYGGVPKAILTMKDGTLIANAGIDQKNAGPGEAVIWPKDLDGHADRVRKEFEGIVKKRLGVMIIDSRTTPSRMGTTGFCLAASGFETILDCRGKKDLFGKRLAITRMAIADDLAAIAHLLMGEGAQRTPVAIIKNAPIKLTLKKMSMSISPSEDLYMRIFNPEPK
ncbi:MAG: coenzyme F420-0:L-glutamate ligase [Nitrososphaerales archaeon]